MSFSEAEKRRVDEAIAGIRADGAKLPGSLTSVYVGAVVALCVLGVAAVVAITVLRPVADNTAAIATILGFLTPTVLALLGAAVREVHLAFNSRMTELLELTAKAALAEGRLTEQTDAAAALKGRAS